MGWFSVNGVLVLALAVLLYQYLSLYRELNYNNRTSDHHHSKIDACVQQQQQTTSAKPQQHQQQQKKIKETKPEDLLSEKRYDAVFQSPTEMDLELLRSGSSGWCRGENVNHRLCRFRSLCLLPGNEHEFLFLHGPDTIISGMESGVDKKVVADLSSIENHNALQMVLTDVLASKALEVYDRKIKMVDGSALLLYRFKPDNLMHVFHDDLLPLFYTLLEVSGGSPGNQQLSNAMLAFVDPWTKAPHNALYQLFTSRPPLNLSDLEEGTLVCFKDAYVGLNRQSLWYQYGFQSPQGPLQNRTVTALEIRRFTTFITRSLPQMVPSTCSDTRIAIFLSRKSTRLVVNEDELVNFLAQESGLPVVVLSLDDTSLVDLIGHVRCADVLVGMHGALLVLSMFLDPGSIFIELFPYAVAPDEYTPYKTLVNLPGMGIIYKAWRNEMASNTVTHPYWEEQLGGINHLPVDVQETIRSQTLVPPHVCCSDPAWLFRIYQDTTVDIESFGKTLKEALDERIAFSVITFNEELKQLTQSTIFPGKVEKLVCSPLRLKAGLNLSWQPPVNLKVLGDNNHIYYEVWLQEVGEQEYQFYTTNRTYQEIFTLTSELHFNIWVRGKLNNATFGAFKWIACKVEDYSKTIDMSY